MTDLPAWLREIRDRADKATKGPWDVVWEDGEAYVFRNRNWDRSWVASAATSDDTAFIAHARTDVPRLIEMVAEMAERLGQAVIVLDGISDASFIGYPLDTGLYNEAERVIRPIEELLAKYRGEAEPTTPNDSYWWCPACQCEVDGTRVTYEELHDVCGHSVEWREGGGER